MSNKIRTALSRGGDIKVEIHIDAYGKTQLTVTESWEKLTGIQRAEIEAETLDAAADPDALISSEIKKLFDNHMNWKARTPIEEPTAPTPEEKAAEAEETVKSFFPEVTKIIPGWAKPVKLTPAEKIVKSIQEGTYIELQPARYQEGKTQGIQVTVEGINPTFSAMRRFNQTVTGAQMDEAENPTALVWQRVYEMVSGLNGPI